VKERSEKQEKGRKAERRPLFLKQRDHNRFTATSLLGTIREVRRQRGLHIWVVSSGKPTSTKLSFINGNYCGRGATFKKKSASLRKKG